MGGPGEGGGVLSGAWWVGVWVQEGIEVLHASVRHKYLAGKPLLILVNKQVGACSSSSSSDSAGAVPCGGPLLRTHTGWRAKTNQQRPGLTLADLTGFASPPACLPACRLLAPPSSFRTPRVPMPRSSCALS